LQEPRNTLTTQPLVRIMQNLDSIPDKFRTKLRNNMGGFVLCSCVCNFHNCKTCIVGFYPFLL